MKRGFTMIELIFVIVILGILIAVVLPHLAATRDDAKDSTLIANTKTCINDAISFYQGQEVAPNISEIPSCVAAQKQGVTITVNGDFLDVTNAILDSLNDSHRMKGTAVSI